MEQLRCFILGVVILISQNHSGPNYFLEWNLDFCVSRNLSSGIENDLSLEQWKRLENSSFSHVKWVRNEDIIPSFSTMLV